MGMFFGQTNEWVAWQWANAKTNKKNIALFNLVFIYFIYNTN